ncbi:hypothetical protein [Proteiniborus sp. MB09-C3]|uniref:hypothetical protein n=1 Tax=Proteiniborus sp. MB09-C3 TaxID=3050072 RepID=UPI0025573BEE|nr:hypothetical protein [Proteiniborus sp. MB09-C3]WIV11531.1 hypothetical protein QO263_15730 [Proteiniborus sp. MB09-C3]
MATWIAHLRVAENILKKYKFEVEPFLVGNIGPDSGVPNEDWSQFDPPKKITHWKDEEGKINADAFYEEYIRDDKLSDNRERNSFLIGYYFHLIADIEWDKIVKRLKENLIYKERLENDPSFIWTVKEDWYGLDFKYLNENLESVFFKKFIHIQDVPDYLDYFPKGAIEKQTKYIRDYYLNEKPDFNREFEYLTKEEMDNYVVSTTKIIEEIGKQKKLFRKKGSF